MSSLKIIFYGTPAFAVASLDVLLKNNFDVIAVVTAPDKPAGRGQKIHESEVKQFASARQLKILQPPNLKDESFFEELKSLQPDLQIVVAFRMMPEKIWGLPPLGTFNLHASLLPQYRGAAPINWAIINGEKETGVTTFFLQHEIDTGNIILQEKVLIDLNDTAGTLHDKLMLRGAELVLKTVQSIEKKNYSLTEQKNFSHSSQLKSASKLNKQNTQIDFNKSPDEIRNFIRGLSPYPVAHTKLVSEQHNFSLGVKIFSVDAETFSHSQNTGIVETDNKSFIKIFVKDGFVSIKEIQMEGKKKMSVKDFLNGFKMNGDWKIY